MLLKNEIQRRKTYRSYWLNSVTPELGSVPSSKQQVRSPEEMDDTVGLYRQECGEWIASVPRLGEIRHL